MSREHIREIHNFCVPGDDWTLTAEQQQRLQLVASHCAGEHQRVLCLCYRCAPASVQAFKTASRPTYREWCGRERVLQHFRRQISMGGKLADEAEFAKYPKRADGKRWLSQRTFLRLVHTALIRDPSLVQTAMPEPLPQQLTPTPSPQQQSGRVTAPSYEERSPAKPASELETGSGSQSGAASPDARSSPSAAAEGHIASIDDGDDEQQVMPREQGHQARQGGWHMLPVVNIKQQWLQAFSSSGLRNRKEKEVLAELFESEGIAIETLLELDSPMEDTLALVSSVTNQSFVLKSLMTKFLKDLLQQSKGKSTLPSNHSKTFPSSQVVLKSLHNCLCCIAVSLKATNGSNTLIKNTNPS